VTIGIKLLLNSAMKRESAILYPVLTGCEAQNYLPLNDSVFAAIISSIKKESPSKTAQSHVIIGEAGSGKTILLKRIEVELRSSDTFYPIAINGQNLFSVDDIWKQCFGGSYSDLLDWQEKNSRRIVLLIDNIQYLFKRVENTDQFFLRGKLNNAGAPILIATSNEVLSAFTDYKAAFFDGLKLSYIRQIDATTLQPLDFNERDLPRVNALLSYLPKTIRSLMLVKRVLRLSSCSATDIDILRDLYAPTFELTFNSFVTQCQRILLALAFGECGMTLQQLRETTQQANGSLSPYLNRMIAANILEKTTKTSRNAVYSIKDRLFKLWLSSLA
jgi:hypothetical protein